MSRKEFDDFMEEQSEKASTANIDWNTKLKEFRDDLETFYKKVESIFDLIALCPMGGLKTSYVWGILFKSTLRCESEAPPS